MRLIKLFWVEICFLFFCVSLLFISYLNSGGFTPSIQIPDTKPDMVKVGAKFWLDKETTELAESMGLNGTVAYLIEKNYVRYSLIVIPNGLPNGFVQMRGSVAENIKLLEEVKRGIELAKNKK